MTRLILRFVLIAAIALAVAPLIALAQASPYEVWVVDQADAARGGAKLYIYPGATLGGSQLGAPPQVVDLEAAATGVGAGPGVRPHLLVFNSTHSHALLAYVASGHVAVIRAADRKVVASIDVGDQAHGAFATPDGSMIVVANQNGKKLARIAADFQKEQFSHNPADDLDLKVLEDARHPDNAPICPVLFPGGTASKKAYVTLRGGGLFIVDVGVTPMKVLKSFTNQEVGPAGCGGFVLGNKVYVNSGTASFGAIYVFDATTDALVKTIATTSTGTDAHGMVLTGGGRYLWMANRGDGDNIVVVDTTTDTIVGTSAAIGAGPDLMDISPAGDRVFVSMRGPNNLTGGPAAKGQTPGMAVLSVQDGGRGVASVFFAPIGDQSAASAVDPHALAVRRGGTLPTTLPRTGEASVDRLAVVTALAMLALGILAYRRRPAARAR